MTVVTYLQYLDLKYNKVTSQNFKHVPLKIYNLCYYFDNHTIPSPDKIAEKRTLHN